MKVARKQIFNEINITPLTDIFLVLLIIMMVVAPMLQTSGLKLAVPSVAPDQNTKEEPKAITVKIDAQNQYTIEGQGINMGLLTSKFRQMKGEKPDGLIIESNPEATHNALTLAMDAAQSAGITKIAVTRGE